MKFLFAWLAVTNSRGRESRTLGFVTILFFTILIAFILSRFGIGDMSVLEFAGAESAVLGLWIGNEWVDKSAGAKVVTAGVEAKATVVAEQVKAGEKVDADSVLAKEERMV